MRGAVHSGQPHLCAPTPLTVRLLRGPAGTTCPPSSLKRSTPSQLQAPTGSVSCTPPWLETPRGLQQVIYDKPLAVRPASDPSHRLSSRSPDWVIAGWFFATRSSQKISRRLRMVVPMVSYRVFLRAFAYERVVQSARYRRWNRMTRRRTSSCPDPYLAECCALRVDATQLYGGVSITSAFNTRALRLRGAVFILCLSSPNRSKNAHTRRIRRSIFSQRLAFS